MHFVLIAVFVSAAIGPSSGGTPQVYPGASFQEFNSKDACVKAMSAVIGLEKDANFPQTQLRLQCVPKD